MIMVTLLYESDDAVEIVGFLLGHGANSNAEYSNKDRYIATA